jgi:hypothetical protein
VDHLPRIATTTVAGMHFCEIIRPVPDILCGARGSATRLSLSPQDGSSFRKDFLELDCSRAISNHHELSMKSAILSNILASTTYKLEVAINELISNKCYVFQRLNSGQRNPWILTNACQDFMRIKLSTFLNLESLCFSKFNPTEFRRT